MGSTALTDRDANKVVAVLERTDGEDALAVETMSLKDAMTGAVVGISYPHYEAHEGNAFICDYVDETLDDNATIELAFKTPAGTKRVHIWIEFSTLVGGDIRLLEAPTWTTSTGSQNSILNRKRLASMTSSGLLEDTAGSFSATNNMVLNPTSLAGGTVIHHIYAWGKKEKMQAGGARDSEEFILKPDTQYAVVFTADGASNKAQVILNWYEHTDA